MTQHQTHIAKEYETIYILRPDVDADAADKVQGRVAEVITREQGTLVKVEAWGRRKLAYPVKKQKKGVYVYVKYVGKGGLVSELERNLKLADAVMKFQTGLVRDEVLIADVAVDPERRALAGDQLHIDLDMTEANLPAGTRLAIGTAVIEITDQPHTGCVKFTERFGLEAHRWLNSPAGQELKLRGLNARVVVAGIVRTGDTVSKIV